MAGGKERAFLARLLRESVLTLCREAMDSRRRFIVDGIVCISLEDDKSGDDCSPIVVTIHEQLPKVRDAEYSSSSSPSPQRLKSPPCAAPPTARPSESETEEGKERRHNVPMDKKTNILSRVKRAQAEVDSCRGSLVAPHHPGSQLERSASEPLEGGKVPTRSPAEGVMDGHLSDPSPRSGCCAPSSRHSLSSDGGDSKGMMEGLWRASLSSPASSDLSSPSPPHQDVSLVGRPGSASPQDDLGLLSLARPLRPSSSSSSRHHLSRPYYRGRLHSSSSSCSRRGEGVSCQECGLVLSSDPSLERHNRQKHSLLTCLHCLSTFTTSGGLSSHARLHAHHKSSSRRHCGSGHAMVVSRRESRQRQMYMYMTQPRVRSRLTHMRNGLTGGCTYALAAHTSRSGFVCSPCGKNFSDPVTYTAHVKCHSQEADFQQYRCCYCPTTLPTYQAFMIHQQAHALQLQQVSERVQYPRQFQTVANIHERSLAYAEQPEEAARRSRSEEEGRFNDSVPENLEKESVKEEEKSKGKEHAKERAEGPMDHEEASSGPRQSWCTECHVGFPDEDTLIQHITDTHESFISRRQLDQHAQRGSPVDVKESRHDPMDTSNNGVRKPIGPEDGNADRSGHEHTKGEKAAEKGAVRNMVCASEGDSISEGAVGEASGLENGGTLRSLPPRSEAMEGDDSDQSFQDADSSAADSLPSSKRSSPLRVIPLPVPLDVSGSPGACSKGRSLITLVKPRDLIIRTESYPRRAASSPVSLPLSYPASAQDLTTNSQKGSAVRTMYSLLNGSLQSGSFVRRSEPHESANVKHEPGSDQESASFCEASGVSLSMSLSPRDSLSLSYCGMGASLQSQDLPKDLSMPRVSSPSPRPTSTAGCGDGAASLKSASFDKVVTPDVLFHARSPPLPCPVQDCDEEFQSFADLEEHSARVHRKYLCSYCGKSFTAKPNRDRHVRVHTGVKPYKCPLCSQAFYRGDDLKYHVTTKHPRDTEF